MKKFVFVVKDDLFPETYLGEVAAYNMIEAIKSIKEQYSSLLKIEIERVSIVSVQEVIK